MTNASYGGKVNLLVGKFCSNAWDKEGASWMNNVPQCVFRNWSNIIGEFDATISEYEWKEAQLHLNLEEEGSALDYLITLWISSHHLYGVTYASRENTTMV